MERRDLHIKAKSPFRQTMIAELSNGWAGYIPTKEGFQHGGYEARFGAVSRLIPEAGDMMAEAALELLSKLAQVIP